MNAKNSIARTQNRRVLITTPFPTTDEVAAELGIAPARVAELKQMVDEILAQGRPRPATRRTRSKRFTDKPAKKK